MPERESVRMYEEIDLSVLRRNFQTIKEKLSPLNVMTVVKANAYGTGVRQIAATLKDAGSAGFCVATWEEAKEVLPLGLPVQILGGVFDFELPEAVANNVIVGITDLETAKRYSAEAVRQGKTLECHFKLDTGMGRMGIQYGDAPEVIREAVKLPNLNCCGIYSHFPKAYTGEDSFAAEQARRFLGVLSACEANGIRFTKIHMANSDAITRFDTVKHTPFNYVRAGIALYGAFDEVGHRFGLDSVVSLKTKLVAVRKMPAGHSIGYERTCVLPKDTLVGTISGGYADGLPLALSNRGRVIYKGRICPILGRISMDYTTISLDGFSENDWKMGDEVTYLGKADGLEIPVEEWASLKGTHAYDILCSISPRVNRFYCGR